MPSRRDFLRMSCCSVGAAALMGRLGRFGTMGALAQGAADYRALVCIFLFGGNDGNNMIVPLAQQDYDAYSRIRADLALPVISLLPVITKSNEAYGLHPKLPELRQLFNAGNLALLANVGTLVEPITRSQYQSRAVAVPENLFSHADQQLQWQTSIPNGSANTGWAGRAADIVNHMGLNSPSTFPAFVSLSGNSFMGVGSETSPVIFTPAGPLSLAGFNTSPASQARERAFMELLSFDNGVSLVQAANTTTANGIHDSQQLAKIMAGSAPLKTTFTSSALGAQLAQVAKIIQIRNEIGMRRQIFFCSLGSFDTHTTQLNDQGALLAQLSTALAQFFEATQEMGVAESVTTFTESDFGRTFQPNTNHGTDHAWGNHHMILGGSVKGGDLYGRFPNLILGGPDDVDSRGRWIPTTSLDQYGGTLAAWFGVNSSDLTSVFPNLLNFPQIDLEFMKS